MDNTNTDIEELLATKPVAKIAAKPATKVTKADIVDTNLTAAEKADIELQAEIELAKELKAEEVKRFKEEAKARLKKDKMFELGKDEDGEDTESVHINLGDSSNYIRLDGTVYIQGKAYKVSRAKAATLKDIMHRTWLHDHEISGKDMNTFYGRRPQARTINGATNAA
jgi:hypothetical protein